MTKSDLDMGKVGGYIHIHALHNCPAGNGGSRIFQVGLYQSIIW